MPAYVQTKDKLQQVDPLVGNDLSQSTTEFATSLNHHSTGLRVLHQRCQLYRSGCHGFLLAGLSSNHCFIAAAVPSEMPCTHTSQDQNQRE